MRAGIGRIATISARFGWHPPNAFEEVFHAHLAQRVTAELRPVDGARELLSRLDLPFCLVSNGSHEEIRQRLDATDLRALFGDRIVSAEDVARPKPAPDVYLFAARRMGVAPAQCLVIEDSVPGVRAAVAAGMRVLARAALTDEALLVAAGARTFHDYGEVDALIAAMR